MTFLKLVVSVVHKFHFVVAWSAIHHVSVLGSTGCMHVGELPKYRVSAGHSKMIVSFCLIKQIFNDLSNLLKQRFKVDENLIQWCATLFSV